MSASQTALVLPFGGGNDTALVLPFVGGSDTALVLPFGGGSDTTLVLPFGGGSDTDSVSSFRLTFLLSGLSVTLTFTYMRLRSLFSFSIQTYKKLLISGFHEKYSDYTLITTKYFLQLLNFGGISHISLLQYVELWCYSLMR